MYQSAVRQLIADRYASVHDARPAIDYPSYCVIDGPEGPRAALGYRRADEGTLFLERYLDRPIELILGHQLGRPVARRNIVEIGDHASAQPQATVALWAAAAELLKDEADIAVAVVTAPLRSMFRRIGLTFHEIAPACSERLGRHAADWGDYYAADPVVCAGDITAGHARLMRWCQPTTGGASR